MSVCPCVSMSRQCGASHRIGEQLNNCVAELLVSLGQENMLAIHQVEILDSKRRRNHGFTGRERLQHFHAHAATEAQWHDHKREVVYLYAADNSSRQKTRYMPPFHQYVRGQCHSFPHVFYHLVLSGLLWLFLMLSVVWPTDRTAEGQRPPQPIKPPRKHSKEPKPFAGLT